MEIINHLFNAFSGLTLHIVEDYGFWGVLIGAFLLGENVIIVAFLLSAQGFLSFNPLLPAFVGSISADFFWYFFNNLLLPKKSFTNLLEKKSYGIQFVNYLIKQRTFIVFTFIKLLVGIRLILTVAFVRVKKFSFFEYLSLCVLSNSVFIFFQYGLAILTKENVGVIPMYHNLNAVVGIALILIVLVHLIPFFVEYLLARIKSTSW